MTMKTLGGHTLGESDDLGRGYDDVDILGLNEFGEPTGLHAIYGALIGAGAGTLGAVAARSFTTGTLHDNAELVGLGAGAVAGGIMAAFPSTRHAGWVAIATAFVSNGLRAIEHYFSSTTATAGYGMPSIQSYPRMSAGMNGLGIVQAQPLNGRGTQLLGPPKISGMAARYGTSSSMSMMGR